MYIFNINIKKLSNWMSDILLSGIFVRFFVGQSSKVAGTKPTINLVSHFNVVLINFNFSGLDSQA